MAGDSTHWVFGYGSLIYKVDFPFLEREIATLKGWERRFWQGSHDHRGTPEAPGRVVTLIPSPTANCRGAAYRVEEHVFEHLDHREKNGYERHDTPLFLCEHNKTVDGTFYLASPDNAAYLGPAPPIDLARHIARSHGPSGANSEYLLLLAEALRDLGESDEHVMEIERELLALER
jgi:cation transport protein ChaC